MTATLTRLIGTGTRIAFGATLHVVSWALYHLDPEGWDSARGSGHPRHLAS